MSAALRAIIVERAGNCCEYCQLPQGHSAFIHEIEHIIARKHHGKTEQTNLALACFECNDFKGSDIAGLDPETGELSRLFHPRVDVWEEHFRWQGAILLGLTPVGRTTIDLLRIDEPPRVEHRRLVARQHD